MSAQGVLLHTEDGGAPTVERETTQRQRRALSVDEALGAARDLGLGPEGDRAQCPICRGAGALTITSGGGPQHASNEATEQVDDEARLHCDGGCDPIEIRGALRSAVKDEASRIETALEGLSRAFGLPRIVRVVRYGVGEAHDLELADGRRIELGTARDLFNRRTYEAAIAGATGIVVDLLSAAKHRELIAALLNVAEQREVTSADEELQEWIDGFRRTNARIVVNTADRDSLYEVVREGASFRDTDGRLHVRLPQLHAYVTRHLGERVTTRELARRLARAHYTKPDHGGQITVRRGDEVTRQRYWIAPGPMSPVNTEKSTTASRGQRGHGDTPIHRGDPSEPRRDHGGYRRGPASAGDSGDAGTRSASGGQKPPPRPPESPCREAGHGAAEGHGGPS